LEGKPEYQRHAIARLGPDVSKAKFRRMMAHYYALVTHIDLQVGRVISRLVELGLFENIQFSANDNKSTIAPADC